MENSIRLEFVENTQEFEVGDAGGIDIPLSVDIERLKQVDPSPMIVKVPLMKIGSNAKGHDFSVNQATFEMVERGIQANKPPAYMGHGGMFGRDNDDGGVGNWIGSERRGEWLYGAAYIPNHNDQFRNMLTSLSAIGGRIGTSIVVGDLYDENSRKQKPINEGMLKGIDFLHVGQAAIRDSESRPDIQYLSEKGSQMDIKNEKATMAENDSAETKMEFGDLHQEIGSLKLQLETANQKAAFAQETLAQIDEVLGIEDEPEMDAIYAIKALQSNLSEANVKLLEFQVDEVVDEIAASQPEMRDYLELFVKRDGVLLVADAGEARETLTKLASNEKIVKMSEAVRVANHGPKTFIPPIKREVPNIASDIQRKTFETKDDEQAFLREKNERLGLPLEAH